MQYLNVHLNTTECYRLLCVECTPVYIYSNSMHGIYAWHTKMKPIRFSNSISDILIWLILSGSEYFCVTEDIVEDQGNKKKNVEHITVNTFTCMLWYQHWEIERQTLTLNRNLQLLHNVFSSNMPGKLAYQWSYTMQASYRSNWFPIIDGQPPVWVVYTLKHDNTRTMDMHPELSYVWEIEGMLTS